MAYLKVQIQSAVRLACVVMFLVASLQLSETASYAQGSRSQINGTVRDSSGAMIPEASVVLRNLETGVQTRSVTNDSGVYVILQIIPGTYTLEASKAGFSTSRLQPFNLVENQASVFDLELQVGQSTESVTVEATGSGVQSMTTELGTVLTSQEMTDLPVGRSIQSIMDLSPGVNSVQTGQSSVPSVNGSINRASVYMLDGTSNTASTYTSLAVNPIMETIAEYKVQSHNDSADVGGVTGGVINVATKSGTNELHGQAYEITQNTALNARNTFQAVRPTTHGITAGVVVGGPVWLPKIYHGKNRTFFFFGYQQVKTASPAVSYFQVPTAANLTGNLSDWSRQIYNPFSTRLNPNGTGAFVRDPFPQNQIPASLIHPGMLYFAKTVLPAPQYIGVGTYNGVDMDPNVSRPQSVSLRIDQKFGANDSIAGRYSGYFAPSTAALNIPSMGRIGNGRAENWNVSWVHTFGPQTVLQTEFGRLLQYTTNNDTYRSVPSDFGSQVGYSANVITPYKDGSTWLPGLSVTGYFTSQPQWNRNQGGDSWHMKANLSRQVGTHTLKAGGEYNMEGYRYQSFSTTIGFAPAQTADPVNLGATGSALASFLLGVPDSGVRHNTIESIPRSAGEFGIYIQDSWKAMTNLTINLGLRYDRAFIPSAGVPADGNNLMGDMDYQMGAYILQVPAPACSQTVQAPCIPTPAGSPAGWLPPHVVVSQTGKILTDTTKNFQPRVGLAYRLRPDTAIRAGVGVFFDNYAGLTQLARNPIGTWPSLAMQAAYNLNYPTTTQPVPAVSALNPLTSASIPAADPFSQGGSYFDDPRWKNPYSTQWNIGIEQQFRSSFLTSVNYVGSESHRTDIGGRYNVAVTPGPGNPSDRYPFPYMPIPFSWDRSWGNANYHALQVSVERRWAQGLAFTAAYTYSKSIDPGSSGLFSIEGFSSQNPYNMRPDRSVSSYDIPQNLVLSWVFDLPFGKSKALRSGNRAIDYLIGNWQANGIARIRSGLPINLTVSGDIANTGNSGYERPDVVGDWHVSDPTPAKWFNTAAFKAPAAYTFGSAGRNILRSDPMHQFNVSAFRKFPIRERIYAEFRAEAYNVFNTVTYNSPTGELTNANFGKVTSAMAPRTMQLGLRIHF